MKKILIIPIILLMLFTFTGCDKKETVLTDAQKFKEEYESLNNTSNSSGKMYRTVNIDEENPMIYKSAEDIVSALKNNESFVVYFGFKSCPWCRSIINNLIKVADDLDIEKIYYVDVYEIRDTLKVNDQGKVETSKEGTEAYYELIDLLKDVLNDYSLTDSKGKAVDAKEKRIYAPNVVVVKDGKGISMTSGISDLQTDSYMELNEEILNDSYNKLKETLEYAK